MKHTTIIKSIFAAATLAATSAWVYTETVGGYTWTCRINGDALVALA